MLSLILLSILGVSITAWALDDVFDDDSNNRQSNEQDDEIVDDVKITSEIETLIGTEGDDTYTRDDFPDGNDRGVINVLGGDDFVDAGNGIGATINGGDGNDTISVTTEENEVNGEAGDDHLIAGLGSTVSGGQGDDLIDYDYSHGVVDAQSAVDAGDGDDTIRFTSDVGSNSPDANFARITGGEGNDTFEVEIDQDTNFLGDPIRDSQDHSGFIVEDFDPNEDIIVVDVTPLEDNGDRELSDVELIERDDESFELLLTFAGTSEFDPLELTFGINGSSSLSLDDFVIVQT